MLYYRLYKKMKQRVGYNGGAFVPLDYGLFAIIIPMVVGSIAGVTFNWIGWIGESTSFIVMVIFVIAAALYLQICERIDDRS